MEKGCVWVCRKVQTKTLEITWEGFMQEVCET